jgi:HPt (histidine-containing phosphotransfer) domain-containing protein
MFLMTRHSCSSKQHHSLESEMPLKTKQHEQFIVLMTSDVNINHLSLKNRRQNIIVASQYDDILMSIETTQFDLILLDFTANCSTAPIPDRLQHFRYPWQSELITRIKNPFGINNETPVIAITNTEDEFYSDEQYPMAFYDCLAGPITEQRVNEVIDLWQTKAFDYVQIILSKTKNNPRLTLTLFEKLFDELPSQVIEIKNALENKQYDLAHEITHKLNGSASFCGLTDIQQSANALESCLLNNSFASVYQHFLILQQCILTFSSHQKFILTHLGKY